MQESPLIYFLFEDPNYAHILWSYNIKPDDLPCQYSLELAAPEKPGVIDNMNMSNLTRMQHSYRWQPHLPFMPVNITTHPFMSRYNYKYDTLPMFLFVSKWLLQRDVAERWASHVTAFSTIMCEWRNWTTMGHMGIDYILNIINKALDQEFETEKQARGHAWHCRTLIFSMFAEFSFLIAVRPK